MGEFVRVERDGAIATIRPDRPPMNALNAQERSRSKPASTGVAQGAVETHASDHGQGMPGGAPP